MNIISVSVGFLEKSHQQSSVISFDKVLQYAFADINKFLWMVRIGGSTDRGQHIKENDYYTSSGEFRCSLDKFVLYVALNAECSYSSEGINLRFMLGH